MAGRADDLPARRAGTNSPPTTRLSPLPFVLFAESQKATALGFASLRDARTVALADSGAPRPTEEADASFVTFRPDFAEAAAGTVRTSAAQKTLARSGRRGIGRSYVAAPAGFLRELLRCPRSYSTWFDRYVAAMLLGVDVGGTFTDAALLDGERLISAKAPSTPEDQSEGVLRAVEAALEKAGAGAADVERFVHGMTVGTNALLEGKVAHTALVATAGFTDLEELGRQARPELYRLCAGHPPPLVPPGRLIPADERCGPDGVLRELDEDALRERLHELDEVEAVAVCLLWGFRHQEHERRVEGLVADDIHVSTSHATAGVFREYERCATTVVDAALSPLLRRYLESLAERARAAGLPLPEVMLSGGGVADASTAARHGSWTFLSGPAGGAVGAALMAEAAGAKGAVCLDMGGTSCDVSVAREGRVTSTGGREVGAGALALRMVDVHTVGAGGGSIAWRDAGGALRVGPQSAGADPGPACYGRGGEEPTVTDANLLLGYLDPQSPLAGGVELDRDAAERAVKRLADALDLSTSDAAAGIARVAGTEMARAVRVMTVERGVDPRELALL